jgi:hypothetical protein
MKKKNEFYSPIDALEKREAPEMEEVLFSEVKDGQTFYYGKSRYIKGNFGHCSGAWYGKHCNNWKAVDDNKKVKVEV